MIDKLIKNDTIRYLIKTIMFPTTYSQYIIINLLGLISPRSKFLLQKTILMTIGVSLLHYFFFPVFFLYKLCIERIVFQNLLRSKKEFNGTINTVCIYAPWFDKYAGGSEAVAAYIAQYFEEKYPKAQITILCDDFFGHIIAKPAELHEINEKYGTSLQRTNLILKNHGFNNILIYPYYINILKTSMHFDVFINSFMDITPSNASINVHYIHFPGNKNHALSKYLFRAYQECMDLFIANSKYTAYWTKRKLGAENTVVVEPPVQLNDNSSVIPKQKLIITAGRISEEKNLEMLIKTFIEFRYLFPEWEYHIIGSKNPNNLDYYQKLERLSEGYPIKFFTNLSKKEFNLHLKNAMIYWHGMGYGVDLKINPGGTEHFGISVVEAMSFGCVPLVFKTGGPADIINDNECGFTWDSPEKLIQLTDHIITDANLFKLLSKKSYLAAMNYSVDNFMEKFGNEINKTLQKVKRNTSSLNNLI
jgi:glycosyltransferase involved in cell wall biosynthesis